MAKKRRLAELLSSFDTFGPTMLRYFDRMPEDYLRKMDFGHWHAIVQAAHERLEKGGKLAPKTIRRLKRIKKTAIDAMLRDLGPLPKTRKVRPVATGRMFVETD